MRFFLLAGVLLAPLVSAQQLTVTDPWVRALPPSQPATAAYLTLSNDSAAAITVTGASSPVAGRVEMHTTREQDGVVGMTPLATLTVAAGETASLAPGGTHLMLLALERMPEEGSTVPLCLQLAGGTEQCFEAAVRRDAGGHHHHHHH